MQGWGNHKSKIWMGASCPKSGKQKALMFPSGLCNVAVREWMICHCVAHPFGAAVGRSSQQAALLEPGAGSHPPLSASVFAFAGKQKTDPEVGFSRFGGEGDRLN